MSPFFFFIPAVREGWAPGGPVSPHTAAQKPPRHLGPGQQPLGRSREMFSSLPMARRDFTRPEGSPQERPSPGLLRVSFAAGSAGVRVCPWEARLVGFPGGRTRRVPEQEGQPTRGGLVPTAAGSRCCPAKHLLSFACFPALCSLCGLSRAFGCTESSLWQ